MKKFTSLLTMSALLGSSVPYASTVPVAETRHAVEISMGGIGPGVDAVAYKKVRQLIGNAIANNVIDKFIVLGYGREGGFSACVEDGPSHLAPRKAFEKFVKRLNRIKPDPSTSFYSVNRVAKCPSFVISKPNTVRVAKSDGGLQCENNGIALSDMQQQLAGITVYAASKENDGLIRVALCGVDAGNSNVYEIAASDLNSAIALGFIEWT